MRIIVFAALIAATAGTVVGQVQPDSTVRRIVLDVKEKTIEQDSLHASTSFTVVQGEARLDVGVEVIARRVSIRLVGIQGTVYFRGPDAAVLALPAEESVDERNPTDPDGGDL